MSLILDLSAQDYQEVYSQKDNLWQTQAYEDLCLYLNRIGSQSQSYATEFGKSTKPMHAHDTVFVSGGRGSGKTVFLKNIRGYWKEYELEDKPTIYFAPIIDPTLLVDHDNFSNVIVATLYNMVEEELGKRDISEKKKNEFFLKLKKLSGALGNKADYEDRHGLDLVIKYTSGIQVERLFHEFVVSCIDILSVDAIAIIIDDVDMALGRAYEVLEVVRKLLLCPLIIPIVSGDESLYQHMVKLEFLKDTLIKNAESEQGNLDLKRFHEDGVLLSESLMSAYLTKVFPQQYRISLEPIDRIQNKVIINETSYPDLPYVSDKSNDSYLNRFTSMFFPMVNGEERSADFPSVDNARELTQLVRTLSPSKLSDPKQLSQSHFEVLRVWAQSKANGAAYTYAIAAKEILDSTSVLSLSSLLPFNPKKQASQYLPWASKNFLEEQKKYLDKTSTSAKSYGVDTNEFLLEDSLAGNVLRSMPPLEMHMMSMIVPHKVMQSDGLDSSELSLIYTYKEYYGVQGNQAHKVFFSRAFELLGTSILMVADGKHTAATDFERLLRDLLSRAPFYSIHAMNPTKYIRDGAEGDESEASQDASDKDDQLIAELAVKLESWSSTYTPRLKSVVAVSLLPLLSAVFNKVFSQLNLVRLEKKNFKNEHVTDFVKRFEYILVNAFATFLKDGMVYKANIAMTKNSELFRETSEFTSREHVFTRNVKELVNLKDKKATVEDDSRSLVLEAVWNHPIFSVLEELDLPSGLLHGSDGSEQKSHVNKRFKKATIETLAAKYSFEPGIDGLEAFIKNEETSEAIKKESKVILDKDLSSRGLTKENLAERYKNIFSLLESGE